MEFYRFHKPGFKKRQSKRLGDANTRRSIMIDCGLNNDPKILYLHSQKDHALLGIYLEILFNLDVDSETWTVRKDQFDRWARITFADGAPNFKIKKRLEWLHENELINFGVQTGEQTPLLNTPFKPIQTESKPSLNQIQTEGKPEVNTPFRQAETLASVNNNNTTQHNTNNPLPPKGGETPFEKFFNEYPAHRRASESSAKREWVKAGLDQISDQVMESLNAWKQSSEWNENDGKFVPNAAKFIREKRWQGKPEGCKPAKKNRHFEAWQAGKRFVFKPHGVEYSAAQLKPYNESTGQEGGPDSTGFVLPSGEYRPFRDFEIL